MSPLETALPAPASLNTALTIDSAPFLKTIVQQIRANDAYGTYRNWADETLLKPYVIAKKKRREIS